MDLNDLVSLHSEENYISYSSAVSPYPVKDGGILSSSASKNRKDHTPIPSESKQRCE